MDTIAITTRDLLIAAALVGALAWITYLQGMRLARSLLIASLRTAVQLTLVGMVLRLVFAHTGPGWVMIMALVMLLVAGREVMARQSNRFRGWWGYGLGTLTMFLSSFTVTLVTLTVIIGPEPWYAPRYAVPLLGMILGNTMTGVALALDSLGRLAREQRPAIEARLMLGQDSWLAIQEIRRQCVHIGLIPVINAMAAAGIVSLPGMMTGQILAGNPPMEAVKYQILIMFLIASGSGFGILAAVWLGGRHLFDRRERLRLDRLT